jgi:hypothetical protein
MLLVGLVGGLFARAEKKKRLKKEKIKKKENKMKVLLIIKEENGKHVQIGTIFVEQGTLGHAEYPLKEEEQDVILCPVKTETFDDVTEYCKKLQQEGLIVSETF